MQFGYPRLWVLLRREGWLVNKKLKQLVADLSLDKKMLQDVLSKKL